MEQATPRLENWGIRPAGPVNPYQPPECVQYAACGNVYGHRGFVEGDKITTSAIVGLTLEGDGKLFVRTNSGTMYELGQVAPDYEAQYPNARQRLIDSWVACEPLPVKVQKP